MFGENGLAWTLSVREVSLYVNGRCIQPGERLTSFRGEPATFIRVSRAPEPGKSGKIIVRWPDQDEDSFGSEYYPSVFDGEIR